jgi:NMD protein affecting ribosome stability and mRNA decay
VDEIYECPECEFEVTHLEDGLCMDCWFAKGEKELEEELKEDDE